GRCSRSMASTVTPRSAAQAWGEEANGGPKGRAFWPGSSDAGGGATESCPPGSACLTASDCCQKRPSASASSASPRPPIAGKSNETGRNGHLGRSRGTPCCSGGTLAEQYLISHAPCEPYTGPRSCGTASGAQPDVGPST